ncbi:MAG: signal peptidase I [Thermogutta sp.]
MMAHLLTKSDDAAEDRLSSKDGGSQNRRGQPLTGRRRIIAYFGDGLLLLILLLIADTGFVAGIFYPIRVVSPSMMPAINGPRIKIDCPRCGFPQTWCAATQTLEACIARAVCPNCGCRLATEFATSSGDVPPPSYVAGDRVLVLKNTWRSWRRWDVVAFYNAGEQAGLTVKRIVGLPGERIEIRDGLLWVDGQPRPRPWNVQRAVSVPVCFYRTRNTSEIRLEAAAGVPHRRCLVIGHAVTTYCPFHPALDQQEAPTRNLILRFQVAEFSPGTRLRIQSNFGTGCVDLVLSFPSQYAIQSREIIDDGKPGESRCISGGLVDLAERGDFAISLVDQQFLFVVNDRVVARWVYAAGPLVRPISQPFQVTVEQGAVTIRGLGLWKVTAYHDEKRFPQSLPGYYVLGDDPHISIDSRHFGTIPEIRIIGRVIKWPFNGVLAELDADDIRWDGR